jgi:hypothetical protein
MLEIRGFLMYVVCTCPWLNPYMKGMHLTVDSWQPDQAEDAFKMTTKEIQALESSCWGRASLLCRREDEDKINRMPSLQGPKRVCSGNHKSHVSIS